MSKKRALSLIEVLLAMTLMMVLMSTLFMWYRHLTFRKGELEKIKRPYLEERYLCQRLEQILPKAQAPFFTDRESLVFRFDRGLSLDPRLSGTVLAKLYHNSSQETLCLGIWPDPFKEPLTTPSLTLTLLDDVQKLSFDFYSPPDPFKMTVNPDKVGALQPNEGWQKVWLYEPLPALVDVSVTRNNEERHFYFDLGMPIYYPLVPS